MSTSEQKLRLGLIKQTLWKWSGEVPEARGLLADERLNRLSEADVEVISDVLLKELLATGVDEESEPTQRGLELEAAIDWIRASCRSQRKSGIRSASG